MADELPWAPLFADRPAVIHPRGRKLPNRTDGTLVLAHVVPGVP